MKARLSVAGRAGACVWGGEPLRSEGVSPGERLCSPFVLPPSSAHSLHRVASPFDLATFPLLYVPAVPSTSLESVNVKREHHMVAHRAASLRRLLLLTRAPLASAGAPLHAAHSSSGCRRRSGACLLLRVQHPASFRVHLCRPCALPPSCPLCATSAAQAVRTPPASEHPCCDPCHPRVPGCRPLPRAALCSRIPQAARHASCNCALCLQPLAPLRELPFSVAAPRDLVLLPACS